MSGHQLLCGLLFTGRRGKSQYYGRSGLVLICQACWRARMVASGVCPVNAPCPVSRCRGLSFPSHAVSESAWSATSANVRRIDWGGAMGGTLSWRGQTHGEDGGGGACVPGTSNQKLNVLQTHSFCDTDTHSRKLTHMSVCVRVYFCVCLFMCVCMCGCARNSAGTWCAVLGVDRRVL